jgi:hypothetical protein
MSVVIKWSTFEDSNADSFNIYRAITGITISSTNSLVIGDQLTFSATSSTVQKITLTATTLSSIATQINTQAKGLKATVNAGNTLLFLRCTARDNPKLKLYPCTFLTHTGTSVRTIVPRLEFSAIASVPFVASPPTDYSYSDLDGDPLDYYHITSVVGSVESVPSLDQAPLITPESLCVVEGRVIDFQNNPIVNAEVTAATIGGVELSDNSALRTEGVSTSTDELGRWSLPVLRGTMLLLQISSIGYNQVVKIPDQASVLFEDLELTEDHYFTPSGDPISGSGSSDSGDDFDLL